MSDYRASSAVLESPREIEPDWLSLQARVPCSWFQSWGWIGTWLQQVVADLRPLAVRVWHGDELVGLGIFVQRDIRRRLLIRSNALFLHEYPFDGRNMSIEYNGILADPGHLAGVCSTLVRHLFGADRRLDEVHFGGVVAGAVDFRKLAGTACGRGACRPLLLEASSTWAIDLAAFEGGMEAWLDSLSKNRRAQIRRSFRLYEASGPLRLEAAADADEAQEYLAGLQELHTRRWRREGKQGVFANPVWESFHRALVTARFPEGEIQLLRVRSNTRVIGYLYNLVWRGHVHVLQTGFEEAREKGMMPGYVVHALAIGHNIRRGMARYDLLHGDELYKKILCDRFRELQWVVLQRRRARFRLENLLLGVKRRLVPG